MERFTRMRQLPSKGSLFDGMTLMSGGFGLSGNAENLVTALKENGVKESDRHLQQLRRGQFRAVGAAQQRPDQKNDLLLCGREQAVREPLSVRQAGTGTESARHAWPSASAPAGRESRPSTPRPGWARWWPKASPPKCSTARPMCGRPGSRPISPSSKPGRAITKAISSIARPRGISIPTWPPPAKVTIAEVEELVPNGSLDPDQIHTPGIFVNRILQGRDYKKLIEFRTTRPRPRWMAPQPARRSDPMAWTREEMAARAAAS